LSVICITLRQNYDYREIITSDWKITIVTVLGLFIRQIFDVTNIAPFKIFPSQRNTHIMDSTGAARGVFRGQTGL